MILRTNNLGLESQNSDLEACDLPDNAITYALNFVLRNNKIYSFNGKTVVLASISGTLIGSYLDVTAGLSGTFFFAAGRLGVVCSDGVTNTFIGNTFGYTIPVGGEFEWTGCSLGSIPIITNPNHWPEYWSPQQTTQRMQFLKFDATQTWKDLNMTCKIIRSHNNFLFALNLIESGIPQPLAYRWSHPADINGLPFSWDPLDLSTIASKESLGGEGEFIVDALSLRDDFFIYTNRGIHVLRYNGQDAVFVFERRTFSRSQGCIATNALVEAVGVHYFLSSNDILMNDGNSVTSVLSKKLKDRLSKTINSVEIAKCFAKVNHRTQEVWFFIVENGFTFPNVVYIINYVYGTVSIREIDGNISYACMGPGSIVSDSWDGVATDAWNSEFSEIWERATATVFDDTMIGINGTSGALYNLEINDNTAPLNTVVQRENLAIDGQDTVKTVTRMYPHIISEGPVFIEMGSHDFVNSAVRWKPGVLFDPNVSRKVDIRTTGKLLAWKISSVDSNDFVLSGMDIEYVHNGTR